MLGETFSYTFYVHFLHLGQISTKQGDNHICVLLRNATRSKVGSKHTIFCTDFAKSINMMQASNNIYFIIATYIHVDH